MKRGQVFVRGQDEIGSWGSIDALDLDDESFRAMLAEGPIPSRKDADYARQTAGGQCATTEAYEQDDQGDRLDGGVHDGGGAA